MTPQDDNKEPDFTAYSDDHPPSIYDDAFWGYGVDLREVAK